MFDYIKEPIRIKAEIFNPEKLKEYNEMGAKIERIPTAFGTRYILPIYVENIFIRNYIIEEGDYIIMEGKNFYACNQLEFEKDHRWFGEKEELQEQKKNLIRADKKKTEYIEELEMENKKLKEEVKTRKMVADENGEHYDMMKDEYEKLKKENKLLKARNEELNENCYGLAKENKELKEQLAECEKDKIKWELEAKGYKKTLDGISFSL